MEQELEQVIQIYNMVVEYLVTYSFQIIGALIIPVVGIITAGRGMQANPLPLFVQSEPFHFFE